MGLVSNKGDNRIINIKSFKIGDKYASALADGLKYSAAETINLAQNRLKPEGALKIIKGINSNVKEVDFSDN